MLFGLTAGLMGLRSSAFQDTFVHGVPNLVEVAPRLWRSGQPPDLAAWEFLSRRFAGRVFCVKLNSDDEGDDPPAVARAPLSRYAPSSRRKLLAIRNLICDAYERGDTAYWHCTAGRERSGLVSAIVQIQLFGLSPDAAWRDMLARGYRWARPEWLQ